MRMDGCGRDCSRGLKRSSRKAALGSGLLALGSLAPRAAQEPRAKSPEPRAQSLGKKELIMQKLAEICVRRPVLATVIILALVVVGGFSYFKLGVDRFPNVEFP